MALKSNTRPPEFLIWNCWGSPALLVYEQTIPSIVYRPALIAALALSNRNVQAESQINRVEWIKCVLYGHPQFDLLRQKVLAT